LHAVKRNTQQHAVPHAYTEDQLVEQPAIGVFAELGWTTVSALEETFGATGTWQRETKGEVVLLSRLRAALERLNPAQPTEAITTAVDELTRDRSAMSMEAANRDVYLLLKEGIKVSMPDHERGGQKTERVQVVDWENPSNNDFLLVSQFSLTGPLYTCRADLVGFVNGLPLVVIELKKPGVPARGIPRESDALQAADSGTVLVQRAAHRLEWHRQPRRLAHGGLGAVL
jgi:type I restriction enzyme, R subunit